MIKEGVSTSRVSPLSRNQRGKKIRTTPVRVFSGMDDSKTANKPTNTNIINYTGKTSLNLINKRLLVSDHKS